MTSVSSIVEGDGEVAALPVVLRRLHERFGPYDHVNVLAPIRVYKDRFLNREEEFRRHLLLAAAKCGEGGWILVVLDADDECPKELAERIRARAAEVVPHRRVAVVIPKREFEAWFIAAAASLEGVRGFSSSEADRGIDAETPRNAKGWLKERMHGGSYGETTDQPAFAARFDLDQALANSRSFRKMCSEWRKNFQLDEMGDAKSVA
ncbi:hypothetical protein FHT39_004294 [Mitsuaria sp. BK045]|uniref:DUF4276 family protein n=1 Tax=unclassified Roseateles TaxID=2626991 RepID=UPI00161FD3D3|nr:MULTISPECIES: DUF4276 family protein [unclassified Roseateles]MBB3295614.1 hypothetical protein [Mitsuaria sp. BK041]MBB3364830.1 hypothetical protein [Mitsuaria sp. BK045]